jgi:hypothetical protein
MTSAGVSALQKISVENYDAKEIYEKNLVA